jgi:mRNA interferase YafQ
MKYTLTYSRRYERSYKKLLKSGLSEQTKKRLRDALVLLVMGDSLPIHLRDHALMGDMNEYRELHIGGDLVVVYMRYEKLLILELVDIGSHAQIFE